MKHEKFIYCYSVSLDAQDRYRETHEIS